MKKLPNWNQFHLCTALLGMFQAGWAMRVIAFSYAQNVTDTSACAVISVCIALGLTVTFEYWLWEPKPFGPKFNLESYLIQFALWTVGLAALFYLCFTYDGPYDTNSGYAQRVSKRFTSTLSYSGAYLNRSSEFFFHWIGYELIAVWLLLAAQALYVIIHCRKHLKK